MRLLGICAIFFSVILVVSVYPGSVHAVTSCSSDDTCANISDPPAKVACYTNLVNACASQRESMASQVVYLNTRIQLTTANIEAAKQKIIDLQKEIEDISGKIDKLDGSLTQITGMLFNRIIASYKYNGVSMMNLLFSSGEASDFIDRFKYIQTVRAHDRKLLFQLQNSKLNFKEQKQQREEKQQEVDRTQKQLEKDQVALSVQKKEKELFLETTKNSEAKYRSELAAAKKEAEGIQQAASILSSAGVAKHVNKGDVIGVMGNTGFSTGAHLHFALYNLKESDLNKFNFNSAYENPLSVLKPRSIPFDATSCDDVSPSHQESKTVGSGSWEWPMANPTISQCYGHTPWSWRYSIGIHNGLDMYDDVDTLIRAPESGNAYVYRGGQSAGNGVFIFHGNGKMTLYWHLQ